MLEWYGLQNAGALQTQQSRGSSDIPDTPNQVDPICPRVAYNRRHSPRKCTSILDQTEKDAEALVDEISSGAAAGRGSRGGGERKQHGVQRKRPLSAKPLPSVYAKWRENKRIA